MEGIIETVRFDWPGFYFAQRKKVAQSRHDKPGPFGFHFLSLLAGLT